MRAQQSRNRVFRGETIALVNEGPADLQWIWSADRMAKTKQPAAALNGVAPKDLSRRRKSLIDLDEEQLDILAHNTETLRMSREMSRPEFGRLLGIGDATIARIENKKRASWERKTLNPIANLAGLTIDELLSRRLEQKTEVHVNMLRFLMNRDPEHKLVEELRKEVERIKSS